jgi:hypothetical protein
MQLFIAYNYIVKHAGRFSGEGDSVFKCNSIYDIEILEKLWGCEIADLYSNSCKEIPRDIKKAFLKLIDRPKLCSENEDDIFCKIMHNDEGNLNGFLCINKNAFTDVNPIYLICNENEWYLFHRNHLATYWKTEDYFYEEVIKYFENIYFHPNVGKSLKSLSDGGLKNFSKTIVFNLTQLNDKFKLYSITSSLRETLNNFSSECGVKVTLEGNASRKPEFTYIFLNSEGIPKEICCESHMKLMRSDNPGDSGHHYNRIHFHQGKPDVEDGKILVGHIGKHL